MTDVFLSQLFLMALFTLALLALIKKKNKTLTRDKIHQDLFWNF